jgi:serine/threonine-protein kinase
MPAPAERSSRLQLLGEIAHGGMGAILKGRDVDIGRDLAVKVLLERHKDKPDLVHRFIEEVQIAGQLQHPGVVPVYELGTFADHRPYFSMKLVKGRTLASLLAERPDRAHDLPRFVSIFEAVCQTVAYAHARGVIHRDLKPSNVMVGGFGEVQVMDWGLAKVLKGGGIADEGQATEPTPPVSVIQTVRSVSDADASGAGTVLGTPAYMSPEQARGDIDDVDRRSDVFGLGSILCEILTGRPAFTGRTAAETQRRAARGDLTDATTRLESCGADPELIALARGCLAREPGDLLRDAGAVAAAITAYLAGVQERLRAAELAKVTAQARAEEERKRRKLQVGLAASVLALTTFGGLTMTYALQQRQARAGRIELALKEATLLRDQARANPDDPARWPAALEGVKRAEVALADGGDHEARSRFAALKQEVEAAGRAARADQELLAKLVDIRSAGADDRDGNASDVAYADAFRAAGYDVDVLGPEAAGGKVRARPDTVARVLAAALDDWASRRREAKAKDQAAWRRLISAARVADPDPRRGELRGLWEQPDRKAQAEALRTLAKEADVETWPIQSLNLLAAALDEAGELDRAVVLLRRAADRHPGDASTSYKLASLLERISPPQRDEAIRYYSAARAVRPETGHELAHALERRGESERAITVFQDLDRLRPGNGRHLGCLARALLGRGQTEEAHIAADRAVAAHRKAIQLKSDDFGAYLGLGLVLCDVKRDYTGAEAAFRAAIRLKPDHATAHGNLGVALSGRGKRDEAMAAFREAIRLKPYARAHNRLGDALVDQGKVDEAIAAYREAIRLQPDDAEAHIRLGAVLCDTKHNYTGAEGEFREAIRLKRDDAWANFNLGIALENEGKIDEAMTSYREAIRLQPDDAEAHIHLGAVLCDTTHDHKGAEAEFREAIRLAPGNAWGHHYLGIALSRQGKVDKAIAAFREAIRLKPDYVEAYIPLGDALQAQRKDEEAAAVARAAIRLKPDDAFAHFNLGLALAYQRKFDEAIVEYREAVRLRPEYAEAYCNLGCTLCVKGEYVQSLAETRKGHELGSKRPSWPYPSAEWVREREQLAAMADRVPALLRGEDVPRDNAERLSLIRLSYDTRHYAAAARFWAEALQAGPGLANSRRDGPRLDAARSAALAGCGQGIDEPKPDDRQRTELRRQALIWLRAELASWRKESETGKLESRRNVGWVLQCWKADPDLAGVRYPEALAKLTEEEQRAWRALWADVDTLLKQVQSP